MFFVVSFEPEVMNRRHWQQRRGGDRDGVLKGTITRSVDFMGFSLVFSWFFHGFPRFSSVLFALQHAKRHVQMVHVRNSERMFSFAGS